VAELRSLSRAGEALNLSQPAVSKTLSALEDAMRQPLYTRTAQGITLTEAGKALLPYATAVSRSLNQATRFIEGRRNTQVIRLRMGLSWSLVPRYLAVLLKRAEDLPTRLQFEVSNATTLELLDRVYQRDLDGAIVLGGSDGVPEPLEAQRIGADEIILLAHPTHPLAELVTIPLGLLAGQRILMPQKRTRIRQKLEEQLERFGIVPDKLIDCGSLLGVKVAAMEGLGIGVTCQSFVQAELSSGNIKALTIESPGFNLGVHWVSHPDLSLDQELYQLARTIVEGEA
jgi:DNA-binding transcriptional LysR family regulator